MIIIVCLTDLDIYLVARIFVEELGVLFVLRSNIWCPLREYSCPSKVEHIYAKFTLWNSLV